MKNKKLYGAWISRNDFILVEEECHIEKALEILSAKHEPKFYPWYRIMFRLGYIRLLYHKNPEEYTVEFWNNLKPTKYQKDFIENATTIDKMEIYYTR